jgi:hypothetical protein
MHLGAELPDLEIRPQGLRVRVEPGLTHRRSDRHALSSYQPRSFTLDHDAREPPR